MFRPFRITAGSRLHFGLLSFGQQTGPQHGGVGVMVARPELSVYFAPAERLEVSGPLAERVRHLVARVTRVGRWAHEPACRIEVLQCPPQHCGLGVGTQLGLCVAQGLHVVQTGRPSDDAAHLARLAGRGRRSWVGTYGFLHGGLIYEGGHAAQSVEAAPLIARLALPQSWRFVLVRPASSRGLSGGAEKDAFADLPPVPPSTTDELRHEIEQRMLPAARSGNLERFGESVFRYGRLAGECFALRQGGPYANDRAAKLVHWLRARGIRGVGQSSWGPTVFALVADPEAAEALAADIITLRDEGRSLVTTIAAPGNDGASVPRSIE